MSKQFDLTRPRSADAVLKFVAGPVEDVNEGLVDREAYEAALKSGDSPGNLYQPPVIQAAVEAKALCATVGQTARTKEKPKEWKVAQLGKWKEGYRLEVARLYHAKNVRKLVLNQKDNIVSVPGLGDVIVGVGGYSAIHSVSSSKTGNFGAIIQEAKRLAFADVDGLDKLVGLVNTAAYQETLEDGSWLVFGAGQSIVWGYVYDGETQLNYDQIASGEHTDVTFRPLDNPIEGESVSKTDLFVAVKEAMSEEAWKKFSGGDDAKGFEKTWANVNTLCRLSPQVLNCSGFRAVQCGMPCFTCFIGDSQETASEVFNFVVGARLPIDYAENKWQMRSRLGESEDAPEVVEAPVSGVEVVL